MPTRSAFQVRKGWHVEHDGAWRLVTGVGRYGAHTIELELRVGIHSTASIFRPRSHQLETMDPGEWVAHVVQKARRHAAAVPAAAWGPAERLARGLAPRPGGPAPRTPPAPRRAPHAA